MQQAWYSEPDSRVFQIDAGQTRFGATVANSGNAVNDATGYIQTVIKNLNGDPAVADGLFGAIPENEDMAALSLAPEGRLEPGLQLRAGAGADAGCGSGERMGGVFFRMWRRSRRTGDL